MLILPAIEYACMFAEYVEDVARSLSMGGAGRGTDPPCPNYHSHREGPSDGAPIRSYDPAHDPASMPARMYMGRDRTPSSVRGSVRSASACAIGRLHGFSRGYIAISPLPFLVCTPESLAKSVASTLSTRLRSD